jgi:hypothetical protein
LEKLQKTTKSHYWIHVIPSNHACIVFALGFCIIIIINLGSRLKLGFYEHRKLKVEGSLPETLLVREPDSAASAAEFKSVKSMTGLPELKSVV